MSDAGRRSIASSLLRLGLAVLAAGILWLAASPAKAAQLEDDSHGLKFSIHCTHNGSPGDIDLDSMTCTLKVSGLPDPLQHQVDLVLLSAGHSGDAAGHVNVGSGLISADAPTITPGPSVLVSRRLSLTAPTPLSNTPQVPEGPPRSV